MMNMPLNLTPLVINPNAEKVLSKRYYRKDENGQCVEDATGLFWRVASSVAAEEAKYEQSPWKPDALARAFYDMMTDWRFLPNSPTLMNAGSELGQLSACFVLPVGDSIEEIFDAVKFAAMIHKSGGGTGFSFSRLRPKNSRVGTTGGVASGPVSFLRIFNTATEQIKQGGTRRGANMGILRIDHPDILEFIRAKEQDGEFNNFNLSVGITEAFMQAVEQDRDYALVNPASGKEQGRLNAREVFNLLVDKAWQSGDPGIIFLDRINRDNPTPAQGEIESTNPCGEQPLLPYEACNLGSLNLSSFFVPGHLDETNPADRGIDWAGLERTIALAVRFLDNVVDASQFPLERIAEQVRRNRKIGLGVMGWADLLYQLRIPYDSADAITLAERIMDFIETRGRAASIQLAAERGPFPAYETSVYPTKGIPPLRNATITTIAPTGTLSILAGCSSGVEPLFALSFARNVMDGERLMEVNPHFEEALREIDCYSQPLLEGVAELGSIQSLDQLPEDLRRVFVTAMDIAPEWHLRMQAAFQRHTDNAVSKTVNFCNSATREEVAEVYKLAFRLGCKGVTIYRDGSRSEQVLNIGKVKKDGQEESPAEGGQAVIKPRPRPDMTTGITERVKIGCGNLYITVNYDDKGICEIFTNTGKAGGCPSQSEATARLASIALRSGIDVRSIIDQLKGIRCPSTIRQSGMKCTSCPDAIAKAIERVYQQQVRLGHWAEPELSAAEGPAASQAETVVPGRMRFCPECGAKLEHEGGCVICRNCGYSKCG